jgi:Uma2 family endonuclease
MAAITRTRIRLGLRSSGLLFTPEEFDNLPARAFDERYRYELIRGVLVVTPPAGPAEVDPNGELEYSLRLYQEDDPRGSALDATLHEPTIPSLDSRRRCDRAIWVGLGRVPDVETDIPAIVVEFVSRSRRDFLRDYVEKRAEYLALGVREYWIIDRFRRIMMLYRNDHDDLVVAESEPYQTVLLPGFSLPLARLLARADHWPPQRRNRRRPPEGDAR